ncbi:MAG: type II toxin-antitoxin system RelE/ParE family toxin [Desulfobacca sp.]|nr:type II toxin-antitoxin system RelE/ParE family toxin [Desulfobacca sp.]
MSYGLELSHQAQKTMKLLDKVTIKRLEKRFMELSQTPYDSRYSEPLEMGEGERKTRVGSWRIIYAVIENNQTIYIFSIEPRGKAYRRF